MTKDRNVTGAFDMGDKPRALEGLLGSWGRRRAGQGAQPLRWEAGVNTLPPPLLWLRSHHTLHLSSNAVS